MRKLLVLAVALVAAAAIVPARAEAAPCGYSDAKPLWIDFGDGSVSFWETFAFPGNHVAASNLIYPPKIRERGAKTIYWDMYLRNRVGTPTAAADPAVLEARLDRFWKYAVEASACPTPYVALNELFGAHLTTPWSPSNAQYRANVLYWVRGLASRGARPFLLISRPPYTGGEAADWWRQVAQVADIVPEVYFNSRNVYVKGPVLGNRFLRASFRTAIARLVAIGIPTSRIGIMLQFHRQNSQGRELLSRDAWLRTVKWQALSAREVGRDMRIATIWSWGWATWPPAIPDPAKPDGACVWLWARNPGFCNGPRAAGAGFNKSRSEGQLSLLRGGSQCQYGRNRIRIDEISQLARLTKDREVAYSALLARLAESRRVAVRAQQVSAAERAVVSASFGGSWAAYRSALGRVGATRAVARAILADELRRREIGRRLGVRGPSAGEIVGFYLAYPDLVVRSIWAKPPPWWLGRSRGLAFSSLAPARVFALPVGASARLRGLGSDYTVRALGPARPLSSVPPSAARSSIAAVLRGYARVDAASRWSARAQEKLNLEAVCRRDDLPAPSSVDLVAFAPFLALPS